MIHPTSPATLAVLRINYSEDAPNTREFLLEQELFQQNPTTLL